VDRSHLVLALSQRALWQVHCSAKTRTPPDILHIWMLLMLLLALFELRQ
jgi:hypothetical protein